MIPNSATIAQEIAQALGEHKPAPQRQIEGIVRTLGADVAQQLLREAQQIEAAGGMLITNGSRRRTIGGVFFVQARGRMTPEQCLAVFGPPWKPWSKRKPAAAPSAASNPAPAPPSPPATWADRKTFLQEAEPGKATTVKVTLIGRPAKVNARPDFTLLLMKHSAPLPALPKGIPVPAKVPETTYVVYIGAKQWRAVAEAIKNPEDSLIIEGTQIYDQDLGAITIFATNTTTKGLQQAKRQTPLNRT